MRRAAAAAAALVAAGLLGVGLGAAGDSPEPGLRVYAASSLRHVLESVDGRATYSFAGSNQLRRQIEAGAPADVFAAASAEEPAALFADGRCMRPRAFATNRLAILVPRDNPAGVRSLHDLGRPGLRLAVGAPAVPVGRATRAALRSAGVGLGAATVSSEASVAGVVAKVALGSADAGVAYATDARTARARVEAVPIPAGAQPPIEYHVCAVRRRGAERAAAEVFIDRLTGPRGRAALRAAGFGTPGA